MRKYFSWYKSRRANVDRATRPVSVDYRALRNLFALAAISAVVTSPAYAVDVTNVTTGLTSIKDFLITAATPIGILAIIGAGFAKMAGRLDWPRFFAVMIGIAIVFGAAQIVGFMGGAAA